MKRRNQESTSRISDPFQTILDSTDAHRADHHCWAYPFQDGPSLGVLAAAVKAKRVLELGTALGYTACWFTHGSEIAIVDTIEKDPEHVRFAQANITQSGFANRITVHSGSFTSVLPILAPGYDIAFFDGYSPTLNDLKMLEQMLRPGGLLISANLGLDDDETKPYIQALCNSKRWLTSFMAEKGQTAVSVRR
jgi:predicted O-methyltransferase YrrM